MAKFWKYCGMGLLMFSAGAPLLAQAAHSHAGSMDVYVSVIPAPVIGEHLARHSQADNRGRPDADKSLVVVALFDHRTGQRIEVAHVATRLRHGPRSETAADLEPIRIDNQIVFGNYIRFPDAGHYEITLNIERPHIKGGDYVRLPYWQP